MRVKTIFYLIIGFVLLFHIPLWLMIDIQSDDPFSPTKTNNNKKNKKQNTPVKRQQEKQDFQIKRKKEEATTPPTNHLNINSKKWVVEKEEDDDEIKIFTASSEDNVIPAASDEYEEEEEEQDQEEEFQENNDRHNNNDFDKRNENRKTTKQEMEIGISADREAEIELSTIWWQNSLPSSSNIDNNNNEYKIYQLEGIQSQNLISATKRLIVIVISGAKSLRVAREILVSTGEQQEREQHNSVYAAAPFLLMIVPHDQHQQQHQQEEERTSSNQRRNTFAFSDFISGIQQGAKTLQEAHPDRSHIWYVSSSSATNQAGLGGINVWSLLPTIASVLHSPPSASSTATFSNVAQQKLKVLLQKEQEQRNNNKNIGKKCMIFLGPSIFSLEKDTIQNLLSASSCGTSSSSSRRISSVSSSSSSFVGCTPVSASTLESFLPRHGIKSKFHLGQGLEVQQGKNAQIFVDERFAGFSSKDRRARGETLNHNNNNKQERLNFLFNSKEQQKQRKQNENNENDDGASSSKEEEKETPIFNVRLTSEPDLITDVKDGFSLLTPSPYCFATSPETILEFYPGLNNNNDDGGFSNRKNIMKSDEKSQRNNNKNNEKKEDEEQIPSSISDRALFLLRRLNEKHRVKAVFLETPLFEVSFPNSNNNNNNNNQQQADNNNVDDVSFVRLDIHLDIISTMINAAGKHFWESPSESTTTVLFSQATFHGPINWSPLGYSNNIAGVFPITTEAGTLETEFRNRISTAGFARILHLARLPLNWWQSKAREFATSALGSDRLISQNSKFHFNSNNNNNKDSGGGGNFGAAREFLRRVLGKDSNNDNNDNKKSSKKQNKNQQIKLENEPQVAIIWETFCVSCFGFSNEVMHYVWPLEGRIPVRVRNEPECFCPGTPRSMRRSLTRLAMKKTFESVPPDRKEEQFPRNDDNDNDHEEEDDDDTELEDNEHEHENVENEEENTQKEEQQKQQQNSKFDKIGTKRDIERKLKKFGDFSKSTNNNNNINDNLHHAMIGWSSSSKASSPFGNSFLHSSSSSSFSTSIKAKTMKMKDKNNNNNKNIMKNKKKKKKKNKKKFHQQDDHVIIVISHKDPGSLPFSASDAQQDLYRKPDIVIARSMYEFTVLPENWKHRDRVARELWVPSRYVKWIFKKSNFFDLDKLFVMPEPIDVYYYDPATIEPLSLPVTLLGWKRDSTRFYHHHHHHHNNQEEEDITTSTSTTTEKLIQQQQKLTSFFKFFSSFKWENRKGWKILLQAYFEEFEAHEQVSLYISSYLYGDDSRDPKKLMNFVKTVALKVLEEKMKTSSNNNNNNNNNNNDNLKNHWKSMIPHVEIISEKLSEYDLVKLYRSVDAFVLPTRGEGWGLPTIQAMSMGLPTIVTNFSGSVDFTNNDVCYLLKIEGLEQIKPDDGYGADVAGKDWSVPSVSELRRLMRHVFSNPQEAKARGARGRSFIVSQFSDEGIAELVVRRAEQLKHELIYPSSEDDDDDENNEEEDENDEEKEQMKVEEEIHQDEQQQQEDKEGDDEKDNNNNNNKHNEEEEHAGGNLFEDAHHLIG